MGADLVSLAENVTGTATILPLRPCGLRRPFLGYVAQRGFDFAGRGVANVLVGTGDVGFADLRKPPRQGIAKQAQIEQPS
jgi:hypothetical protein